MGAVVDGAVGHAAVAGAAGRRAAGVCDHELPGLQQGVAGRRPRHAHEGVGGDAATQRRVLRHRPLAALAAGLDDRHAMRRLRLARLGNRVAGTHLAVDEQHFFVRVFVVHAQQAALAGRLARVATLVLVVATAIVPFVVDREEVHAVVVHAELLQLVGRSLAGSASERRAARHDRVAPGHEHIGGVAGRHLHQIDHRSPTGGHIVEADAGKARTLRRLMGLHRADQSAQAEAARRRQGRCTHAARDELTALGIDLVDHIKDRMTV